MELHYVQHKGTESFVIFMKIYVEFDPRSGLTFSNGLILAISGVLKSPFLMRSSLNSCGTFAARQNMTMARDGWDIKSANIFKLIVTFFLDSDKKLKDKIL